MKLTQTLAIAILLASLMGCSSAPVVRDTPKPVDPGPIDFPIERELPTIAMSPITESPEPPVFSTMEPDRQARAILWFTARRSSILAECRAKHTSLVEWIREGE